MEWVGIKELDLSEKTNLIYLLCSNMDIECLDTSNSPLLETLRCPSNSQLKMLNIKGNPSLQNLDCIRHQGNLRRRYFPDRWC